ncbi:MAG TPA: hypothetical protein VGO39_14525 [Gaiellaceae bacterium]|jgi:hypothetical protein|nr:hypothetical protein [Gaiellaceae bacterium]
MPAIDDVLPRYDVHEVHSIALPLPPADAIARVLATPVASDRVVRVLLRLRGLEGSGTIGDALRGLGLRELARTDGELVLGAAGTPWRPGGGIRPFASAGPGQVRMVTDFRSDGARLTTETRVEAVDDAARRAFLRYWRVVGPFSALIRRRWLKQIARA